MGETTQLATDTYFDFDSPLYPQQHSGRRHAGIDFPIAANSAVYPIASGTVALLHSPAYDQTTSGDYMVIVIKHSGERGDFYAIYGHVRAIRSLRVGSVVTPGVSIGTVEFAGDRYHLHFGINTSSRWSNFIKTASGTEYGWGRIKPPSSSSSAPSPSTVGWVDPIEYLEATSASGNASSAGQEAARTATVLVMDVSGSMGESWEGGRKIDSARQAALQFIEHVEQENRVQGTEHWLSVVSFSGSAKVELALTNNYAAVRQSILQLSPTSSTNLGEGLAVGLQQVSSLPGEVQRYITVLSDGNSNTGLSKSEILSGPVASARSAHICINTVAFGNKGSVDEDFLRRIARNSGCGTYEYAATGFDLFAAYIKIRHHALGTVIDGLSSFGKRVTMVAGRSIALGTFSLPSGQRELQVTLGWSETGRMQLRLFDPNGKQVTASYPGARVYSAGQFAQAIVSSPMRGIWRVDAVPSSTSLSGSQYFAVASIRPGGIAVPLPVPVISIGDLNIPVPGSTPTWALVLISVACIAIGIYALLADAGLL